MTSIRLIESGDPSLSASGRIGDAWAAIAMVDDAELRTTRDRMRQLLEQRPEPLLRTERPGHLTGSALVVDAAAARVLLLLHTKLGIWVQPGGHADGDANLAGVGLREAQEETGIAGLRICPVALDLDIHRVDPPNEDAHLHFDVRFLTVAPPGAVVATNDESTDARWLAPEELSTFGVDEGLVRLTRRGLDLARELLSGD